MAEEEKAPEAAEEGAEEGAEKEKKPLVFKIILIASLAIVFVGIVVFVAWKVSTMSNEPYTNDGKKDVKVRINRPDYAYFELGAEFKMIIHDKQDQHTLLAKIFLGYPEGNSDLEADLAKKMPVLRQTVYMVMGNKSFDELHMRNMQRVKEEMLSEINEKIAPDLGSVMEVVLSDYILQ